ncbi:MAG TPA: tetratricopeptide repeat protein, partial [Gemmatimonadaceae bacterium]
MDYDRLRELQEKFEENPRRYFAPLANEYRKGGQPRRAIEICRAQLAQMPGHMSGQIVYGQALYEASEFEEARQVFERALTLDPENLIALRSLGDMSLQSGNTTEARSWYIRLLDADPKDTAVISLIAEIDASADAVTPIEEQIPGVDTDAGDQPIPFITDAQGGPVGEGPPPSPESYSPPPQPEAAAPSEASAVPAESPAEANREPESVVAADREAPGASAESAPPEGLERHYPVEAGTASNEASPPASAPEPAVSDELEQPLGA